MASRDILCAPPSLKWAGLLLARMLDLNDVQEGELNVAFRVADDNGLPLIE